MAISGIDFTSLDLYSGPKGPPTKELGKDAFLELLVAQLRHQDPLDPLSNQDFIGQLAQLTALESSTNLNTSLTSFISGQSTLQAVNFIGKTVKAVDDNGDAVEGVVTSVTVSEGEPVINVGNTPVKLKNIVNVSVTPEQV